MTTWVMRKPQFSWPYDLICVQIDEEWLLFIREDGKWDLEHVSMGLPTAHMWWRFDA